MSGHSKWSNIKHRKESSDKKRAQLFSKLSREISIAARKEPNPEFNPHLRTVIEKARKANMPQDNIQRAINKSSEAGDLEELVLEGYGPDGVAIIVVATTDNKNRTVAELKKIFKDHEAKWADPGSVLWAFTKNNGEYEANFPQEISDQTREKINNLVEVIEDHDDVNNIYINAKPKEDDSE